jgi:hypothetical protein
MPMQDGVHMATALGLRALKMYPLPGRDGEFEARVQRARQWLEQTPAQIHTQQAFRLLGLAWADAGPGVLRDGMEGLLSAQRKNGGWAQLANLESDAWATGLALLALNAAGLETTDKAYVRGMEFLVNTQFEDGSWFVRSRSNPSQPHFDSHFPFGWDQWISAAGTALASASLALALDPVETSAMPYTPAVEIVRSLKSDSAPAKVQAEGSFEFRGTRTIEYARDIQPLFENSCLDCHSGDKPKCNFSIAEA